MAIITQQVPLGSLVINRPAVIPISTALSEVITLAGLSIVGIQTPATITGTALSFEVSDALAGTYVPLKNTTSGTALSYTVAASGFYAIDPKDFAGVQFLKIKSNGTELAARTLLVSLKGI